MIEVEPLSELARALVADEKAIAVDRSALRSRVRAGLEAAAPGVLETTVVVSAGALAATAASPAAAAAKASAAGAKAAATWKVVAIAAAAFTTGTATGVLVERARGRAPDAELSTARAPETASPLPAAPTAAPPASLAAPTAEPPAAPATPTPERSAPVLPPRNVSPLPIAPTSVASVASSTAPPASDLARERALVDAARAAVTRGHADDALDAVRRHAETFPNGRLTEEREAIRILALAARGQRDEALRHDAAFRARYPESLFRAQIDAALARTR